MLPIMPARKKIPDEALAGILFMLSPRGGFTLRYVAELYGVSPTQIWRVKRGVRKPADKSAPAVSPEPS